MAERVLKGKENEKERESSDTASKLLYILNPKLVCCSTSMYLNRFGIQLGHQFLRHLSHNSPINPFLKMSLNVKTTGFLLVAFLLLVPTAIQGGRKYSVR